MRRRDGLAAWTFHRLCFRRTGEHEPDETFEVALRSSSRFFDRLGDRLPLEGRTVLDVGCGTGSTCIEAAGRGARRVVGVDIQEERIAGARSELERRRPVRGRVEFVVTDGSLRELGGERFDVVLSKDSFEHYREPERFARRLRECVRPGGLVAIGFGPLWKGPTGGHLSFMTPLPWAHLLFSEEIVLAERRRFRPQESAGSYKDVLGGLNKMTLERFRRILADPELGLECVHFATNVSASPVVRLMDLASKVPGLEEYFTANVYGVWRLPSMEPASST